MLQDSRATVPRHLIREEKMTTIAAHVYGFSAVQSIFRFFQRRRRVTRGAVNGTADIFESHRSRLFGVAYRMLVSVPTRRCYTGRYLRWHETTRTTSNHQRLSDHSHDPLVPGPSSALEKERDARHRVLAAGTHRRRPCSFARRAVRDRRRGLSGDPCRSRTPRPRGTGRVPASGSLRLRLSRSGTDGR